MKKFLTTLVFGLFLAVQSNAEVSVGVTGNAGFYDMSGKETFNSARNTAETKSEDDVLVGYLAGFAEIHLHENIRNENTE